MGLDVEVKDESGLRQVGIYGFNSMKKLQVRIRRQE